MGSLPAELSLDHRPKPATSLPKTITDFITEVSMIGDASVRLAKLDDLISKLQEELKKIEAFKRELPLCMLLLNDVIMALKMQSVQWSAQSASTATTKPFLKEFIPWKKNSDREEDKEINRGKEVDSKDKKNWLSSAQLWNADDDDDQNVKQDLKLELKKNEAKTENTFQSCKRKNGEKSFLQFNPCPSLPLQEKVELPVKGLSLFSPMTKNSREKSSTACSRGVSSSVHVSQPNLQNGVQQQPARKQRRCWSPELHRRFVNALHQLGGSQAATPKQIRELMQVDGLTNDEVKSHLQKYRLHTRRVPTPSSSTGKEPMVVLGGLWMSQDQGGGESSKASTLQSGSPEGPLQLGGSTGATSITACNSMEDDEDEKSESYSWRSHIHKLEKDDS